MELESHGGAEDVAGSDWGQFVGDWLRRDMCCGAVVAEGGAAWSLGDHEAGVPRGIVC